MRRPFHLAVAVVTILLATAAAATPAVAAPETGRLPAAAQTPGTAWTVDPATGRVTVTVDETVTGQEATRLRESLRGAGVDLRREPGRLRTLLAGGDAIYGSTARCSLGANARSGSTYYLITAGHCTNGSANWWTNSTHTIAIGVRTASSFPGNDYGLIRYTSRLSHPSAVNTYPGLLQLLGTGTAYVGQAVCRSGATTGVRCGVVTALNATVNYPDGTVTGLIRTNICAENGDSGGPLYTSGGIVLGILSGGTGNCTTGGSTYYQPIGEILAVYGLTIP
ncbi:S1 family peptidase [Catellatospora chokoriensis]|uniref:Serine protease n=1 Tax=Catellatospora chokoriensis TaxID=310353 RepID=A0A8J3NPB0_9ACTN|nr:S1 family peptidase [Catellatospora chokoriensis]GIF87760.1 serine protease [Catellatospora chokoriensis]